MTIAAEPDLGAGRKPFAASDVGQTPRMDQIIVPILQPLTEDYKVVRHIVVSHKIQGRLEVGQQIMEECFGDDREGRRWRTDRSP